MERPSEDALSEARRAPRPAAGAPAPVSGVGALPSQAGPSQAGPSQAGVAPPPASSSQAAPPSSAAGYGSVPEWYVGIAGEPVGPIDLGYLKAQIDAGKVTAESLVWREELTDWRALNGFEELRALLPEQSELGIPDAAVSDPVALTRVKERSSPGAEGSTDDAGASGELSSGPLAGAAAAAAAAVSTKPEPIAGFDTPAPLSGGAVPPAAARAPLVADEPQKDSDRPPDSMQLAELAGIPVKKKRRRRKRGMHPMAWAFIAMAASFGGVAAYVLLAVSGPGGAQPSPSASHAGNTGAASGKPSGSGASSVPNSAGTAIALAQVDVTIDGPGDPGGPTTNGSGKTSGSAGPAPSAKPPKGCKPDDPFCDQGGPDGPSTGSSGSGSDGSGRGLTPAQAQSVVNRNRRAVSRKCMGLVRGKGSAKIFVSIKIAPSGAVSSVSASGGKDYPGLASCVRSRVNNWRFPQSGASTTVQVSFNFIAQ